MPNPYTRRAKKPGGPLEFAVAAVAVLMLIVVGLAIIGGFVLLGGFVFQLLWNYGLVALVGACGGSVAKIGFWTAVVGNLVLQTVLAPVRRSPEASASK
jgi:hypothetical protein